MSFFAFSDAFGFVKIPFLLILYFLRNPYTEVPYRPLFSFC